MEISFVRGLGLDPMDPSKHTQPQTESTNLDFFFKIPKKNHRFVMEWYTFPVGLLQYSNFDFKCDTGFEIEAKFEIEFEFEFEIEFEL